jgi:hypothetical protein
MAPFNLHINVKNIFHMNYHVWINVINMPKSFHITFHMNYLSCENDAH